MKGWTENKEEETFKYDISTQYSKKKQVKIYNEIIYIHYYRKCL